MSVDLKITLGTVNYTDFLHVTVSKVSTPAAIDWEDWIDVPVSNYLFVVPNLDPSNYYVRYYDAPTSGSLGTLVAELLVNALTGDTIFERRFYTVNGGGPYDPIDTDTHIVDPYLIGKNVTGLFKEGFRYHEPGTEYTFDTIAGDVAVLTGVPFNDSEKLMVEIKYTGGSSTLTTSSVGLYVGNKTVTDEFHTLLPGDANKRIRCLGIEPDQTLYLPSLASIADGAGFYIDNSIGGIAYQVKLLCNGLDEIHFNGFNTGEDIFTPDSNVFGEFWASKGEHVLIRKYFDGTNSAWEIIGDYKGVHVGEKVTIGKRWHPGILPEEGQLIDGSQFPRLLWWVRFVLPATHKYNSPTDISSPAWAHTLASRGQFAVQASTPGFFRMPDSRGMSEKGLGNWVLPGSDVANRGVDYPGGFQDHMLSDHQHNAYTQLGNGSGGPQIVADDASGNNYTIVRATSGVINAAALVGNEMRVRNIGVIYGRRI